MEVPGADAKTSLFCGTVQGGMVTVLPHGRTSLLLLWQWLQVTETGVYLIDAATKEAVNSWSPPDMQVLSAGLPCSY